MPQALHELVKFRGDKLFNGAVNIDWFGTDELRVRAASDAFVFHGPEYHGVSQSDVGTTHGHQLLDTANFALSIIRRSYGIEDQPFTLAIAGYGTGKSHLGLTLASLLTDPQGQSSQTVLRAIDAADQTIGSEIRAILQESGKPCLVVALNGMKSFDLTTEVTHQIIRQVKARNLDTRPLDELRPRFSQAASLIRMANEQVKAEIAAVCDATHIDEVLGRLEQQDESTYVRVHDVFSAKGMAITALRGESVRDIIDVSVREYCGNNKTYQALLILFDEFGRYTEFATVRSQIAGSGVLQDLFEGIQANSNAVCFSGFIQFELNAYIQRVAPEYKNEILRYVTRYQAASRVYLSINLETLIANLLEKRKPEDIARWFNRPESKRDSEKLAHSLSSWFPQARHHRLWGNVDQFHTVVRKGCWPLSVYSTWLLFHLAAVGKHLQERSALALLGQVFERFRDSIVDDDGGWVLSPVDFWSDSLQQELINSEEGGQQGSITHAYASVDARHGANLTDDLKRLLRAVVLASKMGLQAADRDDVAEALAALAGLSASKAKGGVRLLQEEYNVIEWDDAFKQFDILGDAVPRTQFLSFIRQRVASTYDDRGKAALFASKASKWCDLLSDLECDFAEENKIFTREWRYQGFTSNLDNFPMHVKLASDRWQKAIAVDDPRGTVIYCYVERDQDADGVMGDLAKILKSAAREREVQALPILTVLLHDEDGVLGQALAELAVLEESLTEADRLRFGNLIPAHTEKQRQVVRSQVDAMIKQRKYVTPLRERLEAQRLGKAGTELFAGSYKTPLTFPFDGFGTARGNAADSCQELTRDLLRGALDYDAVMGKPVKVKNRALTVLKDSWGIFAQNGNVMTRPRHPVIRTITTKWDDLLASGERRLPVDRTLRQLCGPPYGANIASAALLLGVFVAPRSDKLIVVRDGQTYAISQWVQEDLFRGKFFDLGGLSNVDLVMLGEESSEWEVLLDEWEQAESYSNRVDCLKRATVLKQRIPIPPTLSYRVVYLDGLARSASKAISDMHLTQEDAFNKLEPGEEKHNVSLTAWGAAILCDLTERMQKEQPLWSDHEIATLQPHIERAKQEITQSFREWLNHQSPRTDTPDAVGDFKHRMLRLLGGNLKKLELTPLYEQLEKQVGQIIRKAETAAEARQLIRDVRSWEQSHGDARRIIRVADGRALLDVGREYTGKLQGMSQRIQMQELGEVRTEISDFLGQLKVAIDQIVDRAKRLWNLSLHSNEDLDSCLENVESLIVAFENCANDLGDLNLMRRALRTYKEDYKQLADDRLTWPEFEDLADKLKTEAQQIISDDDVPWKPSDVITAFVETLSKRRKEASTTWIDGMEADVAPVSTHSAAEANRLYTRASTPPSVLTESHAKRLAKVRKKIESRLDSLKVDWLVEKYKELSPRLRKTFRQVIEDV